MPSQYDSTKSATERFSALESGFGLGNNVDVVCLCFFARCLEPCCDVFLCNQLAEKAELLFYQCDFNNAYRISKA